MRAALFVFAFAALVVSCRSSAAAAPPDEPPATYIAFAHDFAGYRRWTSFTPDGDAPGNDHVSGPRTVYVNRLPAPSAHEFPIGTIFVKESGTGDIATRHVFASVKRGGGFNALGAKSWEFFELEATLGDEPGIVWRGFGPTNGDAYGGPTTGGCNTCHSLAHWDYSWTAEEEGLLTPSE